MRWSVAAMVVLGGCSGRGDSGGAPPPTTEQTADWPSAWSDLEDQVLALVNQQRTVGATCGTTPMPGGLTPLDMDPKLRLVARLHSQDMAVRDFFDHVNPDGDDPFDRMAAAGFDGALPWGENIAAGQPTAEDVVDSWMHSEGHCDNIMLADFTVIGVGLYSDPELPYSYWWTQDFAASH